jgi:hypothetical protein
MKKDEMLCLRLPLMDAEKVREMAKKWQVSTGELVRRAIEEFLKGKVE